MNPFDSRSGAEELRPTPSLAEQITREIISSEKSVLGTSHARPLMVPTLETMAAEGGEDRKAYVAALGARARRNLYAMVAQYVDDMAYLDEIEQDGRYMRAHRRALDWILGYSEVEPDWTSLRADMGLVDDGIGGEVGWDDGMGLGIGGPAGATPVPSLR